MKNRRVFADALGLGSLFGGLDYRNSIVRVGLGDQFVWVGFGVVGYWGLGCGDFVVRFGLWGPIKTNQGSGVTFGTCLLLRSLALYPESSICISHLQTSYSSHAGFGVAVTIKIGFFCCLIFWIYVPYGRVVKKLHQKKDQKIWGRKHIRMSKSTFPKILGPSPWWSC